MDYSRVLLGYTALLLCLLLSFFSSPPHGVYALSSSPVDSRQSISSPLRPTPPTPSLRVSMISPLKTISVNSTNTSTSTPTIAPTNSTTNGTGQIELCLDCVTFMKNNLNALINIVEKVGVTDTCAKLCGMLNNSVDVDACTTMCDDMGVENFWQLFVKVDINPIYACELVNACVAGKSPAATFTASSITPPSGPPGTTFTFSMQFTIVNETGVGETAFVIYFPSDNDYNIGYIAQQIFPDYLPGEYQANLTFPTNSSFIAGKYLIIFDLCSGACGLDPEVYPFATEEVTFNITNIGD